MPDTAAVPVDNGDGLRGLPGRLPAAAPAAPRVSLCFARTELGDRQVRENQHVLPLHVARLLLLFEGPQTAEDLRRMIDAPWLPEALIELERRRLIHRLTPQQPRPQPQPSALDALQMPDASLPASPSSNGDPALVRRRALTRVVFLRLLGSLGSEMARRIDRCQSTQELDELMPQVDALLEALAGREALGEFRHLTPRSS